MTNEQKLIAVLEEEVARLRRVLCQMPVPAPERLRSHSHDWQPTDNILIDRCAMCGEERA